MSIRTHNATANTITIGSGQTLTTTGRVLLNYGGSTATSNLMIGVTASAGAIVYLLRGGIDPYVAGPTAIGVFLGASIGSRVAHRIGTRVLRLLFVVVLLYTAFQMARRALGM